ncbi:chemotaxis-specific protein-glutamate methyltransferase CheB [Limnoglobus roseus]|uniref:protein-glutamate methylesterase n=1 Tax=Limnoglobus roseus TaxID=2598579 RepID=A0A5C1A8Q4_9BACT|nr:chemotaxis-specific protein-glutamate methyltransferase CheB [Limnoglobus roseus]QEL13534.1 chemotaxis-specific protein-glutamate methyltransferase CheB [Limnoglobus roseus]
MNPLRVAIVDDLALARAVLRRVVGSVPGYQVAWEAADGAQAVAKAAADKPDAILMDLVMPHVDGAAATRQIMAATPCPILIVTSSIGTNLTRVYEALGAGGLDAVNTPTLGPDGTVRGEAPLLARLATIAKTASPFTVPQVMGSSPPAATASSAGQLPFIAIGASTGGPAAVAQVLSDLGPNVPAAVVVVQHIGSDFTPGLAGWLSARIGRPVGVCPDGARAAVGTVSVAGGERHLILDRAGRFQYTDEPNSSPYRPSVDLFFESLLPVGSPNGVAVLLTGMGADGARGLRKLRDGGWHTIAQDEATCVVYGMPKAAGQLNAAVEVLPLARIGAAIRTRFEGVRHPAR